MKQRPDLILLDISMPGGDGFTVAGRIQNSSVTSGIPLIFMTASKESGLQQKAESIGAAAFLTKPIDSTALLAEMNKALSVGPEEA